MFQRAIPEPSKWTVFLKIDHNPQKSERIRTFFFPLHPFNGVDAGLQTLNRASTMSHMFRFPDPAHIHPQIESLEPKLGVQDDS